MNLKDKKKIFDCKMEDKLNSCNQNKPDCLKVVNE